MNDYRGTRSPYGGAHPGKWPFLVDRDDIRAVFFRDPATHGWHRLEWEHAPGIDAPFSADAARYVRTLGGPVGPARRPAAGGAGPARRLGPG